MDLVPVTVCWCQHELSGSPEVALPWTYWQRRHAGEPVGSAHHADDFNAL